MTARARRLLVPVALVALAGAALAEVAGEASVGDPAVVELLSGIDFVPPRASLDEALGDDAADALVALARGHGPQDDPGVRLRAYRALALYPGPATRAALVDAVAEHGALERGIETLYLRAAMDSLARVTSGDAVPVIAPQLGHPGRDVRAAAASALAATGSRGAIPPLRSRLQVEEVEQVRLAISDAIRSLER